jgi:hypothetical protein
MRSRRSRFHGAFFWCVASSDVVTAWADGYIAASSHQEGKP